MNKPIITYSLLFIIANLWGCIEPFSPVIDDYEDLLVVEAMISDEQSSQVIKLTRSHPIDTSRVIIESGATVFITDVDGKMFEFFETEPGHYIPQPGTFIPEIGNTYLLSITTKNGKLYDSDPVTMRATPPIKDLYFERKSIPSDETGDLDDGFQIYLNTGSELNETGYYKFDWVETFEIVTPFKSFLDYDYQTNEIILRENNISNCWIESPSTNLNLTNTENLSIDVVREHPIRFISFREPLLRTRYSLLVKQYSLSEGGYRFWQDLKESNESTGSLYDAQPFQVIGNIKNTSDPAEPVLGYFDMATVSSKRIFIVGLDDLPEDVRVPSIFNQCRVGADSVVSPGRVSTFLGFGYLISRELFPPGTGVQMVVKRCIDCRSKGSDIKPEFWD